MIVPESFQSDDVEHLLRNAQLRDELEPLLDESIDDLTAALEHVRTRLTERAGQSRLAN